MRLIHDRTTTNFRSGRRDACPAGALVTLSQNGTVGLAEAMASGQVMLTYALHRGGLAELFRAAWVSEALSAGAMVLVAAEDAHDAVELHRAVEAKSRTRH